MTEAELAEIRRVKLAAMLEVARQAIAHGDGPRDAYLAAAAVRQLPTRLFLEEGA